MYEQLSKGYARLKLFINNDWVWVTVKLKKTDLDYLNKRVSESDCFASTLERRRKKFFLRFAYEERVKLNTAKVCDQKICAVDLGINTDATCSVLDSNGTVAARHFINHAAEKDRLNRVLNRIKGLQQYSGSRSAQTLWVYAKRLNDELSKKTASEIVGFAIKHDCDVIVFEHLDSKGRKHGSKKQILSLWKKNYIQEIVTHKAHQNGIRVSHVCAKNTSKLAYDGSGTVSRGRATGVNTYELCKFQNGKIYNCDLSASYNIGARYFIREYLKSLPQKVRSLVQAKVPELERRTSCTYNSFLTMLNALGEITV